MKSIGHWVDGRVVEDAKRYGEVYDPATGDQTARVAFSEMGAETCGGASAEICSRSF